MLGLEVSDGLATADLSPTFQGGGGSFSVLGRLAQVVFTLTQFEEIHSVAFRINGAPVEVFSSEGVVLDRPQIREDFLDFLPMLFVDDPAYGGTVDNPVRVSGVGAAFEASFQYALVDTQGTVLSEGLLMTDNGTGWGSFDSEIAYEVEQPQSGALRVWDHSMETGELQNFREYPLQLNP